MKQFLLQTLKNFRPRWKQREKRAGIAGLWLEEEAFLKAVEGIQKSGFKDVTALTPYPVHGLEEALSIPRSWIPYTAFVFGLAGCLFGLWFTWWASAVSWPLIIGGKPLWSLPAFIPVIFELTILFAALSAIGAFIYACGLPRFDPPVIDPHLSSHKFALFIPLKEERDGKDIRSALSKWNPHEVLDTEF